MKSEREIREKIDEYMDKINGKMLNSLDRQNYYGIVDALLWVIGDESGAKI